MVLAALSRGGGTLKFGRLEPVMRKIKFPGSDGGKFLG
jgi:hypothetical protein